MWGNNISDANREIYIYIYIYYIEKVIERKKRACEKCGKKKNLNAIKRERKICKKMYH